MREAEVGQARLARSEELAAAADVEIDLSELEAVVRAHERLESLDGRLCQVLARTRDQEAVRLLGAAADAAAQLVQLGEAEAVGFLDDHDRRVRHVDADLDHRRRDEHVQVAGLEARHQLAALGRTQTPVQQADAVTAQLGLLQALGLGFRRPGLRRLRLLDQRADDVRLASRVEVFPQPRVRGRAPVLRDPRGLDRLAVGGRLVISDTARSP